MYDETCAFIWSQCIAAVRIVAVVSQLDHIFTFHNLLHDTRVLIRSDLLQTAMMMV